MIQPLKSLRCGFTIDAEINTPYLTKIGSQLFDSLVAQGAGTKPFLTRRCIDSHIGAAIRVAAGSLQWHPDVVWVAHSLRHGVFSHLHIAVQSAVDEFVAGVTETTFRGYTQPMAQRLSKT